MTKTTDAGLPANIDAAKAQAKRLRAAMAAQDNPITLSNCQALEFVAKMHGRRSWGVLRAEIEATPSVAMSDYLVPGIGSPESRREAIQSALSFKGSMPVSADEQCGTGSQPARAGFEDSGPLVFVDVEPKKDHSRPRYEHLKRLIYEDMLKEGVPESYFKNGIIALQAPPGVGKTTLAKLIGISSGTQLASLVPKKLFEEFEPIIDWDWANMIHIDELLQYDRVSLEAKLPGVLKMARQKGITVVLCCQDFTSIGHLLPSETPIFGLHRPPA